MKSHKVISKVELAMYYEEVKDSCMVDLNVFKFICFWITEIAKGMAAKTVSIALDSIWLCFLIGFKNNNN